LSPGSLAARFGLESSVWTRIKESGTMSDVSATSLPYDQWEAVSNEGAFEDALMALREVVSCLETGQLRLNDSVRCFELGTILARRCERLLEEAELRISRLDAETGVDTETDDI
jgi:exodeoxyribonuclease VII small subunit